MVEGYNPGVVLIIMTVMDGFDNESFHRTRFSDEQRSYRARECGTTKHKL